MTNVPTLKQVLAHLKQRPPSIKDHVIAAKATELLRSWGVNGTRDRVSRPLVNMTRRGKSSSRLHGNGVKQQAIFEAMAQLGLIPGVPRELLVKRMAMPQRDASNAFTWRRKYFELLERTHGGSIDREVTVPMLTPEILKFFGLERNPVYDEIDSDKDIWWSDQHKAAHAEMIGAAENARFVRLAGQRGSGKSLVGEAAKKKLRERPDITLCEPSPILSGVLTPTHLITTVIQAIKRRREERDEVFAEAASPVKRALMMRSLLVQERHAQRRVVMWIDESHELRADTFKALKRFLDELHGGRRLIGVVLIGQHAEAYNPRGANLSEVTLRMQTFRIERMNDEIPAYLRFKIERAGGAVSRIITKHGLDAIAERCPFPLDANALFAQLLIEGFKNREKPIGQEDVEELAPAVNQDHDA